MNPGLLVKLRPTGPWRIGPDSGARNRVDAVYHSDSLYAAACSAMARLGLLEEWLDATARSAAAGPAVAFSSCFPFLDDIRFVAPPRTIWPPTSPALLAARVRWKSARFVPLSVAEMLLTGQTLEESQWTVDGPSECLAPASALSAPGGPFRTSVRWNAAVDRLSGFTERHSTACLEYRPGAGLWCAAVFADDAARDKWMEPVKGAFRWLADAGFGGERSRGWGRSAPPEFTEGPLRDIILTRLPVLPKKADVGQALSPADLVERAKLAGGSACPTESSEPGAETARVPEAAPEPAPPKTNGLHPHWLLSLFTPAAGDDVDWSRGNYTLVARAGRVEGSGELKKNVQMVAEGSVIYAADAPRGAASDVAPDGAPHPVFRAGFAVSIPLTEAM